MSDQREDFQKMVDQWEKAQQDGIFACSKKPPAPAPDQYSMPQQDYGMSKEMASVAANSEKINDADYWSAIFKLSRGEAVENRPTGGRLDPNPSLMQEAVVRKNNWTTDAPNPVPFWTRGKDQDNRPTHWFDPDDLLRLAKMKEDLHNLGNKLAGSDVVPQGAKSETVLREIRKLQRKIDVLSDNLTYPETKGGERV